MRRVTVLIQEPKCKICGSADRDEIDALLLLRSDRAKDSAGVAVTTEYVVRRCVALGVVNPNKANLTTHWKRHCDVVDDEERGAHEESVEDIFAELLSGKADEIDVDRALKAMLKQGFSDFVARVKAGKAAISVDQMVKIADALERRKQSDAQRELLGALTEGIGSWAGAIVGAAVPAQLGPGEVVHDAEFEEILEES